MSLDALLKARIKSQGPLTIAEYMTECLLHPTYGYYTTRDPLGRTGDFITAPEVSQMFGEMLGLCLVQTWIDQDRPAPFALAELGPGRGTLMRDILRATSAIPGFNEAAQIWLLEASPTLRARQTEALGSAIRHIEKIDDLPDLPLFFVANEFFDALPVRQFVRDNGRWRERHIGLLEDRLAFGLGPALPQPALNDDADNDLPGDFVEYAPGAAPAAAVLGERIEARGGAGLIVDYGDWGGHGDTLQAVCGHQKTNPLEAPGQSDLTAHVNFKAIARATPCGVSRLCSQGVFLERLGITARAQKLASALEGERLDNHIAAHRRLTHPDEMGHLFKVLGLYPSKASPPPGLET
ncbi:MAG: SAM-dependent methyltransferase [Pseudomonadota bacterium]